MKATMHKHWRQRGRWGVWLCAVALLLCLALARPSTPVAASGGSYRAHKGLADDNCYTNTTQQLVNAIVRIPIYDWDQDDSSIVQANADGTYRRSGKAAAEPVGYAYSFRFATTPVPSAAWLRHALASPHSFSGVEGPAANPLLYQRAAILGADGWPQLPALAKHKGEIETAQRELTGSTPHIAAHQKPQQYAGELARDIQRSAAHSTLLTQAATNLPPEAQWRTLTALSQLRNGSSQADISKTLAPLLASRGVLQAGTRQYQVNGSNAADQCYPSQDATNQTGRIPAYAFSVVGEGSAFYIPGSSVSRQTMLTTGRASQDGISIFPASRNGKDSLVRYNHGTTSALRFGPGTIGDIGLLANGNSGEWFWGTINLAASTRGQASPLAPLPVPRPTTRDYHDGFQYYYQLHQDGVELPGALHNRQIDWAKSKTSWMDSLSSTAPSGRVFPHLYLKLTKPYRLNPHIERANITPDGNRFRITPQVAKHGYNQYGRYTPAEHSGGSTINTRTNQPFARARLIEMVLKPGTLAQAIRAGAGSGYTRQNNGFDESFNGLEPGQVCNLLKGKLGDEAGGVERCSELGPELPITASESTKTINLLKGISLGSDRQVDEHGRLEVHIPADSPPGTKYCYATYISNLTNDIKFAGQSYYKNAPNYNPAYQAPPDGRYLSRLECTTSGHKPSFQVRGGDVMAGGSIRTLTNEKEFLLSGQDPKPKRTYGSWVEYGAIAGQEIIGFASGAGYRVGLPSPQHDIGPLSFANQPRAGGIKAYGSFGTVDGELAHMTGQFGSLTATATPVTPSLYHDGKLALNRLPAGAYHIRRGSHVTIAGGGQLDDGKSIILLVDDGAHLTIAENIELKKEYPSITALAQVVLAPSSGQRGAYTIAVAPATNRVDAWLLAPRGKLNTCLLPGNDQTPRGHDWACYNQLTINGPVVAGQLYLRRSGGRDQNTESHGKAHQSTAAETFTLRPDAYLWAQHYTSTWGRSTGAGDTAAQPQRLITTSLQDLPPRF